MDKVVKAAKVDPAATEKAGAPVEAAVEKAPPRFLGKEERSKTVPLECPLEYDGIEYREITVRRLKGTDFNRMQALSETIGPDVAMVHCMTGIPAEVIRELDAGDYMEVLEQAMDFLPRRLREAAEQLSEIGLNTPQ